MKPERYNRRPCKYCEKWFRPDGPTVKACDECRVEIRKRNAEKQRKKWAEKRKMEKPLTYIQDMINNL